MKNITTTTDPAYPNTTNIIGLRPFVENLTILSGPEGYIVDDNPDYDCIFIKKSPPKGCILHTDYYHFDLHGGNVWCDLSELQSHDDIYIGFDYGGNYYTARLSNGSIYDIQHDEAAKIELVDSAESFHSAEVV